MKPEALLSLAKEAMMKAYAPYSGFFVGAALLTKSGKVYTGCNIENGAYTPTNCAERTALFTAVSQGERSFRAIAIVSDSKNPTPPCGVCRQVLAEFCSSDMPVILGTPEEMRVMTLGELLPFAFTKKNL